MCIIRTPVPIRDVRRQIREQGRKATMNKPHPLVSTMRDVIMTEMGGLAPDRRRSAEGTSPLPPADGLDRVATPPPRIRQKIFIHPWIGGELGPTSLFGLACFSRGIIVSPCPLLRKGRDKGRERNGVLGTLTRQAH